MFHLILLYLSGIKSVHYSGFSRHFRYDTFTVKIHLNIRFLKI